MIMSTPTVSPRADAGTPPQESRTPPLTPHLAGGVALLLALCGAVLACVPATRTAGWILLPVALVVAAIAVFLPRTRAVLALTAAGLAALGSVASVGAYAFEELIPVPAVDAYETAIPTDGTDAPLSADEGTLENPLALGTTIHAKTFDITIDDVDMDATQAVLDEFPLNVEPDQGFEYISVGVTLTFTGNDTTLAASVSIGYYDPDTDEVYEPYMNSQVAPDPELDIGEIDTGETRSGNTVIMVPEDGNGILAIEPSYGERTYYVSID